MESSLTMEFQNYSINLHHSLFHEKILVPHLHGVDRRPLRHQRYGFVIDGTRLTSCMLPFFMQSGSQNELEYTFIRKDHSLPLQLLLENYIIDFIPSKMDDNLRPLFNLEEQRNIPGILFWLKQETHDFMYEPDKNQISIHHLINWSPL